MYNPFSLKGKVILITGTSSGIGKECAISCSKLGAKVILIARNEEKLKSVFSELEGDNHLCFSLDVTEYGKIESVIKESVEKLGKIDGFIHSAGIEITKPLKVMNSKDYEKLFSVNVIAGFEFAKIITKKKYSNDGSSFIYIASIMSNVGMPALVGYCSSKGAIVSGIRSLACEFSSRKIRFNCISPAHIDDTEMSLGKKLNIGKQAYDDLISLHPLGAGKKEDIANASIYLLSEASRWVTGINLIVDGGYSVK